MTRRSGTNLSLRGAFHGAFLSDAIRQSAGYSVNLSVQSVVQNVVDRAKYVSHCFRKLGFVESYLSASSLFRVIPDSH